AARPAPDPPERFLRDAAAREPELRADARADGHSRGPAGSRPCAATDGGPPPARAAVFSLPEPLRRARAVLALADVTAPLVPIAVRLCREPRAALRPAAHQRPCVSPPWLSPLGVDAPD